MKILVAYYSWTGNTARVAQAIADRLGCDIEEVREHYPRMGRIGRLRCALDSLLQRKPQLLPFGRTLHAYDLVILGCPVWGRKMASPLRSFIDANRGHFSKTAAFCTEAGVGGDLVLETIARACGAPALNGLVISQSQLTRGDWQEDVDDFVRMIRQSERAPGQDGGSPMATPQSPTAVRRA